MVYFLAHVTSQALVDHQFVEMESYGITKDVFILPRGRKIVQSQMEYFCLTGELNFYSALLYIYIPYFVSNIDVFFFEIADIRKLHLFFID